MPGADPVSSRDRRRQDRQSGDANQTGAGAVWIVASSGSAAPIASRAPVRTSPVAGAAPRPSREPAAALEGQRATGASTWRYQLVEQR